MPSSAVEALDGSKANMPSPTLGVGEDSAALVLEGASLAGDFIDDSDVRDPDASAAFVVLDFAEVRMLAAGFDCCVAETTPVGGAFRDLPAIEGVSPFSGTTFA
jgi:hypothetical protein